MLVWEAARSTTAAPTYFVPFSNQSRLGTRSYYDGGLYHNNPSKIALEESCRIWPEKPERHPDVLLSVGCDFSTINEHGAFPFFDSSALVQAFKVVRRRFEQILNSERHWIEVSLRRRFHRRPRFVRMAGLALWSRQMMRGPTDVLETGASSFGVSFADLYIRWMYPIFWNPQRGVSKW
jgi:hypothetical protein